jgi:hypothetical protein
MARQAAPVPKDAACAATTGPVVTFPVHFRAGGRGRRRMRTGGRPTPPEVAPGRIPRVSRLLALAIRYDQLIRTGVIRDHADIARLGGVSKARVSQVMALLDLCPAIQEAILSLPRTLYGRDPITERQLRPITATLDWDEQRALWCMGTQVGVRSQTIQNPGGRSHAQGRPQPHHHRGSQGPHL